MPVPALKSLAKKAGIGMEKAEKLWKQAKSIAADEGRAEDWPYVMGILKKSMGMREDVCFADELLDKVVNGSSPEEALQGLQEGRTIDAKFFNSLVRTIEDGVVASAVKWVEPEHTSADVADFIEDIAADLCETMQDHLVRQARRLGGIAIKRKKFL